VPAVVVLAYASLLTLGLLDNIRGPFFLEILQELGLSGTSGSAFFAATSFLSFFGSYYEHNLLRKRDPLAVMAGVSLVFALGFAAISRAPNLLLLLVGAAVFGWGYGSLNALQNVLVCEAVPAHSRRRYLNGLQSMYGLAAWLAPVTATWMRLAGLGWRSIFLILAVLPVLVAVPAWRHRGEVQAGDEEPPAKPWSESERRMCFGFMALLAIYLWGELSISTRLVLWLRSQQGFSPEAADAQLALFFVLMLGGRLALALIAFKRVSNWAILTGSVLSSAVLYYLGLKISPYFVAFCGLTLAPFFPVILDQVALSFGDKSPRAVGAIIGVGNMSIFAMHVSVGALTDLFDLSKALLVGPAALLLAGLGLVAFGIRGRRALTP
jgi:DHA1 family purine ribonucleoside efflux pump-like MFS transporter